MQERNPAPNWFRDAIDQPAAQHFHAFQGMQAAYRTWGRRDRPPLLLVHGGAAHSHWWDFIAPQLSDEFFVLAVDLIGMGDSDHLPPNSPPYSAALFSEQLTALCADARIHDVRLLGHSMGGRVGLHAAALNPDLFPRLIVADARVRPPERLQQRDVPMESRSHRVYPDLATGMSHFRLLPAQPCENPWIVEHIARHSLRAVDGGWQWKFDRRLIDLDSGPVDMSRQLREVGGRMALIYGENSILFTPETLEYMRDVVGPEAPFVALEGARHHLFLDQPLAFIDQARTLLRD